MIDSEERSKRRTSTKQEIIVKSFQGFSSPKQEKIYFEFVMRANELLQAEILVRRLGNIADFDRESWEVKIIKVYKALTVMEKHKMS